MSFDEIFDNSNKHHYKEIFLYNSLFYSSFHNFPLDKRV